MGGIKWRKTRAENIYVNEESGRYYLRVTIGGAPTWRSLRATTLAQAKANKDSLLVKIRAKEGRKTEGNQMLTRDQALELLWDRYRNSDRKESTIEYRRQGIEVLRRTLPFKAVSRWLESDVLDWWASPEIKRYSATRRNAYLGTLRDLIELCLDCGAIEKDLARKLKRARVIQSDRKIPTREEVLAIIKDISAQGKRVSIASSQMVAFLAYSGLRVEEARCLNWEDIGPDFIKITGGEDATKNYEIRHLPINSSLAQLIGQMESMPGAVFHLKSPRFALKNACERLGFQHYNIHSLRHFFITTCLENGVDVATLARWVGHKDGGALLLKTYAHITDKHALEVARRLEL